MEEMDDKQKTALDFWLEGISFENDFKPYSDQKTSNYMKSIGHTISKSGIFKWRAKYNWNKELEFRIKQITSEDSRVRASIVESSQDEAIEKTMSDLERNKALLGNAYGILELKCKLIMEKYKKTFQLSNEDVKLAIQITMLTSGREDRLLDRKVMGEALGRADALKAIAQVAGTIEFEGEGDFEDADFDSGDIQEADIDEF